MFHSAGWLEALRRTYGYEPRVYTTSPPDAPLANALLVSAVRSWLTGTRFVAGPFADHCDALVDAERDLDTLLDAMRDEAREAGAKYVELRPSEGLDGGATWLVPHQRYWLHVLDLRPSIEELLSACHKDSIQRKIQRARREALRIETGRSEALLIAFYALLGATRRRHYLPPQPIAWFRNLIACLGDAVSIRVAFKDACAIGAILTIRHGDTLTYKYGGSNATMHAAGAMPALMWSAIVEAKAAGLRRLDLGRSDIGQHGLITFKDRFGAARHAITYYRGLQRGAGARSALGARIARAVVRRMPDRALRVAGRALYRHVG